MQILDNTLKEFEIKELKINDDFWNERLEKNHRVTLEHQYQQLVETKRLDNFKKAAAKEDGDFYGMFFNDSDVYKWLEAASYSLENHGDPDLAERIDKTAALIASAQAEDGYLNTYFMLEEPDKKWSNLGMMHELYCAGHLFQAAAAHYRATDKKTLLDVACKFADLIDDKFRQKNHPGAPGHEEIELGLIELYRVTSQKRYLKLAEHFINNRGHKYFKKEIENLENVAGTDFSLEIENFDSFEMPPFYKKFFLNEKGKYDGSYAQDQAPVREQSKVAGHAVRAMYLYSGMTDLVLEKKDEKVIEALSRLWHNMTEKRMYITGGIGSTHEHEGFTEDYDLPNKTAYAESCAAVGSIMWNQRLLKLTGESRYANLIERTLYNGLLAGVAVSGDKFFYVNPLASDGDHHRKGWFHVSCCPPNIARLLASLEKYIYLKNEKELFVNLFIGSKLNTKMKGQNLSLKQEHKFPWEAEINFELELEKDLEFVLKIRYPEWAEQAVLKINSKEEVIIEENGYIKIARSWNDGDRLQLEFKMPIEKIKSHPKVAANRGKAALKRGPLVYCLEEVDNNYDLDQIMIPEHSELEVKRSNILNGIRIIKGQGFIEDLSEWENKLYRNVEDIALKEIEYQAVPYYAWDHREEGKMRVWMRTN